MIYIIAIVAALILTSWLIAKWDKIQGLNHEIARRERELARLNEYHKQARAEILDLQRRHRKGQPLRVLTDRERLQRTQAQDKRFKRKD